MISCFLVLIPFLMISSGQECKFMDSITNKYELDLTELQSIELDYWDGSTYSYSYSVCANNIYCVPHNEPGLYVSIGQSEHDDQHENECWWWSKWDNGIIQPSYDSNNKMWTFEYYNGESCENSPRYTAINWHCNPNVKNATLTVLPGPECGCNMMIESSHACINTPPPPTSCIWYDSDNINNVIDLTSLNETVITAFDDDDDDLVFTYTPCRNDLKCDNELSVMSKLENITTDNGCERYLSVWDDVNNNIPTYDSINRIWQFEYNNGEMCNGLKSSFFVYWYCDESIPKYKVKNAKIIDECLYEISILSALACK